ncbi:hypothetical protein [Tenacibaculum maritimum]|uniref:hypothetical protein n=2 Tax=Tenacibaculum maritimum TaxID=107401 RepID=UPI001E31868C|nr:hypothetical protein [Tenacibaculum maritimum]MCD9609788.1 hypothetical protein [Tenacibaculum maritimum]
MLNYILDNSGGLPPNSSIKLGGVKSGLGDLFSNANTGLNSGVSGAITSLTNSLNSGAAQGDPLAALSAAAGSIPIYGQYVQGGLAIAQAFGAGAEAWESVKARADQGVLNYLQKAADIVTTSPTSYTVSLADKYLALEVSMLRYYLSRYSSSNSKRSINRQIQGIEKYRKENEAKLIKLGAKVSTVTTESFKESLKSYGGNPFVGVPSSISHRLYALKSVKTPIDLPPRPIQTITTPNGEVVDVPPKGVDTSYELKWWQYLLIAVPFLLAFLYYLIKKILKK